MTIAAGWLAVIASVIILPIATTAANGRRTPVPARGGTRDTTTDPVTAAETSFTVSRREALRSVVQTLAATTAHTAAAVAAACRAILRRLLPRRPTRSRPRVSKWRPAFPAPKTKAITRTGTATITVLGADTS